MPSYAQQPDPFSMQQQQQQPYPPQSMYAPQYSAGVYGQPEQPMAYSQQQQMAPLMPAQQGPAMWSIGDASSAVDAASIGFGQLSSGAGACAPLSMEDLRRGGHEQAERESCEEARYRADARLQGKKTLDSFFRKRSPLTPGSPSPSPPASSHKPAKKKRATSKKKSASAASSSKKKKNTSSKGKSGAASTTSESDSEVAVLDTSMSAPSSGRSSPSGAASAAAAGGGGSNAAHMAELRQFSSIFAKGGMTEGFTRQGLNKLNKLGAVNLDARQWLLPQHTRATPPAAPPLIFSFRLVYLCVRPCVPQPRTFRASMPPSPLRMHGRCPSSSAI
jgi:hypothetical protein